MKYFLLYFYLIIAPFTLFAQCPAGPSVSCDGSGTSLDLYWVGIDAAGNGNWSSPCSWRVGGFAGVEPCQAPRSIDNVFFFGVSFLGATPTISINTQARCNNFSVDASVNVLAITPVFELTNPGFVEVYGNFTLQTNLVWNVVGGNASGPELSFKSTNAGNLITSAGHNLYAVQFDGIGGDWALQDVFNAGSINFVHGFLNTSDGITDHNMNILTFDSHVIAGGTSANRRIDLNSSIVTVSGSTGNDRYPYNTTNAPNCIWECRTTGGPQITFNAGTSEIIFSQTSPFVRLGGITYNTITHTGTGRFYDHFGSDPCVINTMETNGYLYFHQEHTFGTLQINSVGLTHDFFHHQTVTGDLIVSGNVCNPTILKSEYNRLFTMPAAVTADPMNGFTIDNLRCSDGTAGHAVGGNSLGTTTGWSITTPVARDLYWVGGTNNNWSEPTNWATSNTGAPLLTAGDCPPLQTDNVFFTAALANGATVTLDQDAYCNNHTWTITAPATFNGANNLSIYGDLQLDSDILFSCSQAWYFYGTSANTILSAGITLPATSYIQQFADYTLLDDLNFNSLYLYTQANFNSAGFNMSGTRLYFRSGVQDLSGSIITLAGSLPWSSNGNQGTTTYDASSHVIFTNASSLTRISGWGPNLKFPSFTLQSPNTTLQFYPHLGAGYSSATNNMVFEGDVNLMGSVVYYANYGTGFAPSNLAVMTINGDLTLNAGELYEFGVNAPITVSGNLVANGSCSESISIRGINGASFDINVSGTSILDYCGISDMHSVGAMTATNSADAGNNVNITFTAVATTTYYWRALAGSCPACNYDGDWGSTAGYWTTNPASVEGVPGCIPSASDNVVFDNMSFSGAQSTITINSAVLCRNLTVIASNARIVGAGALRITGTVASDGTLMGSGFTGILDFISNNAAGETIDFGGVTIGCDVNFANTLGSWTLSGNSFTTTKDIFLNSGTLNTNGETLEMRRFNSNNSNVRELNLGVSIMNVTGTGNFTSITSPTNIYTWNTTSVTNFTFDAGTSEVNITTTSEPTLKSNALTFYHLNFTSTLSAVASSPVLLVDNWQTEYMKFDCSARIYGDNAYDTLEFTAGNVYSIEANSVQTLNAPNGILIATGAAGNEIAIKSISTGTSATFHKLNTGGIMTSFCFDYISVEDNFASSDDPAFVFFTGLNSNDIASSGIWDFTRALFITPSIEADPNVTVCPGNLANINWDITGSGPYSITYTIGGGASTTVTLPNGTPNFTLPNISHYADTEYEVTLFTGDNCGVNTAGTLIDVDQMYNVPDANPIAQDGDNGSCNLSNENQYVNIPATGSERPMVSVLDITGGTGLGNVDVDVVIDATVQTHTMGSVTLNIPYLQRHFGINPDNAQPSTIRLYFSQAELDALSTAYGSVLSLGNLAITKFDNDVLGFTGTNTYIAPTGFGTIPAGITTSANVLYLEFPVTTYSHFFIHPNGAGALPVELINFSAKEWGEYVIVNWTVASELNADFYEVQRSKNGFEWEPLDVVNAKGNTNNETSYSLVDKDPINGTSYYRLKQIDNNGDNETFDPVQVEFLRDELVSVFPNPNRGDFSVEYSAVSNTELELELYDALGKIVYSSTKVLSKGTTVISVNINDLSAGVYWMKVSSEDNNAFFQEQLIIE
ncbi:MAG: hypothetical protein ACI9N1_001185 [Flavobacteriales bacterium]|jgi:hypothetical protein